MQQQWPYHAGVLISVTETSTLIPCPVVRDHIVPLMSIIVW